MGFNSKCEFAPPTILLGASALPLEKPCLGFPDSSVDKESACNAGNPDSIPRSGRSVAEGIGYPLQYSGQEDSMDYTVAKKNQTQ